MEQKPKVSLLLLTHDRYQMTKYCLENLLSKIGDIDYELLIFDNGSTDKRVNSIDSECQTNPFCYAGANAVWINNENNLGIAKGFNNLLRSAKGDYICFLSNDILVGENWLMDLLHYNQQVERSGLTSIHHSGEKGAFQYALGSNDSMVSVWKPTNNVTNGISLINRDALNAVGGFDESLGLYGYERKQFAERLHILGFNNYYIPDQYSVHLGQDQNDTSDYKIFKDKQLQLNANRYKESLNEMKKSGNFKIEL